MRKRILAICVLLFVLLAQTTVYAASGALSIDPVSAKPGEQIQLKVNLQNPGIIATRILVNYDSKALRLDKAENGDVFEKNTAVFGKDMASNPYILLWDDSLRTDNITKSGTLAALTFTVLPGATGDKTSVRVTVDKGSTFDVDLKEVTIADAAAEVLLSASGTTAKPTETAKPADTTKPTAKPADTTKAPAKPAGTTQAAVQSGGSPNAAAKPADTTRASVTTTTKAAGSTNAAAGTTKAAPGADKTTKSVMTAKAADSIKTTAAAKTNETANPAASTAKERGKPAAAAAGAVPADATAANAATVPDIAGETVTQDPDYIPNFAEPLPHTNVEESTTEAELLIDPIPPQKNSKQLLWLLLLIPAAAVVVVIVLKKKKSA